MPSRFSPYLLAVTFTLNGQFDQALPQSIEGESQRPDASTTDVAKRPRPTKRYRSTFLAAVVRARPHARPCVASLFWEKGAHRISVLAEKGEAN